ncbi:MAG: acireductone synthase [Micromonosporaceae bacterium]|nr:acireductone synthase [Micromonosporaceae bacterium]
MIAAIVLDIEGTTSSLSHVRDHFFPYSRQRVSEWLRRSDEDISRIVEEVRAAVDRPAASLDEVAAVLREWIDADLKTAPLKSLQGLIWRAGFATGELVSHVYEDVPAALRAWRADGVDLHVFSSGSVLAQQLWFRHTQHGDLSELLSGHFDTVNAGPKREPGSYAAIGAAIDVPADRILFLSDTAAELDAARMAGWRAVQVIRPDDGTQPAAGHPSVAALDDVRLDDILPTPHPGGLK